MPLYSSLRLRSEARWSTVVSRALSITTGARLSKSLPTRARARRRRRLTRSARAGLFGTMAVLVGLSGEHYLPYNALILAPSQAGYDERTNVKGAIAAVRVLALVYLLLHLPLDMVVARKCFARLARIAVAQLARSAEPPPSAAGGDAPSLNGGLTPPRPLGRATPLRRASSAPLIASPRALAADDDEWARAQSCVDEAAARDASHITPDSVTALDETLGSSCARLSEPLVGGSVAPSPPRARLLPPEPLLPVGEAREAASTASALSRDDERGDAARHVALGAHALCTVALLGAVGALAWRADDIALVMSYMGGFVTPVVAFVLPALCYRRMQPLPIDFRLLPLCGGRCLPNCVRASAVLALAALAIGLKVFEIVECQLGLGMCRGVPDA